MTHLGKVAPELVLVEWMDSRRPESAWQHLVNAQDWSACRCTSVGFLIADDDAVKVLAPNMADMDDASNVQLSGAIVIPSSCVLSVKRLTFSQASRAASARSRRSTSAPVLISDC